jgi:hypothetical protein
MPRIATLPSGTPTADKDVPFDSSIGGAKRTTPTELVRVGLAALSGQAIATPVVSLVDDFEQQGTAVGDKSAGSKAFWLGSAKAFGFPGSGFVGIEIGADEDEQAIVVAPGVALALDSATEIVLTWKIGGPYDSDTRAAADDGIKYQIGMGAAFSGDGPAHAIALTSEGDGVHHLTVVVAGVPHVVDIELPEATWRYLRIRATASGASLDVSSDNVAWTTLGTSAQAPSHTIYHPFIHGSALESIAGPRTIVADAMSAAAKRDADAAGDGTSESPFELPSVVELATQLRAALATDEAWDIGDGSLGSPIRIRGQSVLLQGDGSSSVLAEDIELTRPTLATDLDAATHTITNLENGVADGDAANLAVVKALIAGIGGTFSPTFATPDASVSSPTKVADWVHLTLGTLHVVAGNLTYNTTAGGSTFRPFFDVNMPSAITTLRAFVFVTLNMQTISAAVSSMTAKGAITATPTVRVTIDYSGTPASGFQAFCLAIYD